MLEELKGHNFSIGMITNGKGEALGVDRYFDVILVSEWEGIKKPDPQNFKRGLD
ncbi:HAD family hydrolase [Lysinibacillus sp. NPDC096418]|uniref:HAD family hydrolase n=1 Tax=Lysinibacillus sp. NPDC096418 TaxID=3364138 RepID=UPI0037FAE0C3